ncbi:hypothetical protein [uncultured Thiodictyon sp.]|uniref:restriction endonuclease subunit S n=1 Tax=uncultured Thiodictyon sp. TaxID=1846217 RepID=UPI0025DBDA13|nr:hypothetical protein [uncultured Thiodictyon sp.]
MFAAYPGDLVFSKIDARNGAVGMLPASIPKAIVTSEYPVLIPDPIQLSPAYLGILLRAEHFHAELQRQASGTSGRKRVTADGLLTLEIPLPSLAEQDTLVAAYTDAIERAAALETEAGEIESSGLRAFQAALGVTPAQPLSDRPLFIARFKDLDRWSHEGVLRAMLPPMAAGGIQSPMARLGDLIADLENGWSPKCHDQPARTDRWGVLKVGAVSFGTFEQDQNKELPEQLKPRPDYEVKVGDVLISRANVTRYVGACACVRTTRPKLLLCDKIFRVRFRKDSLLLPEFLAEAMRLPTIREQIEGCLTGTSPTMKNISKPSLLGLRLPVPSIEYQKQLVDDL